MHWNFTNTDETLVVNLEEDSSTGAVWGTVGYLGYQFPVTGSWQASEAGGNQARVSSNLSLTGHYDTDPDVPTFVSLTGLIRGTAPDITELDVGAQIASSADGTLSQLSGTLNIQRQSTPPSTVTPVTGGAVETPWTLCSLDGSVTLEVLVGTAGRVTGQLVAGETFGVEGRWVSAGGVAGRNATAFQLYGRHQVATDAYDMLGAAGVVTGSPDCPQKIELNVSRASISAWQQATFQATLLPMYSDDADRLAAAYAESYMVIQLGGTHGDSQAVAGWKGPVDGSGNVGPFGSGNYPSAGTALSADELAGIAGPDPSLPDTNDIKIPAFQSAAGTRPVMIQFVGEKAHFPQPPLQEYHEHVTKVFYDDAVGALVLQFADVPGGSASSQINFNEGRARNHNSVIIEPR